MTTHDFTRETGRPWADLRVRVASGPDAPIQRR
jgi:hypothetical protein